MPKVGMGQIRREQICRAAAHVIAARGLDGTTLREVAEVAGVSTGTINHYFQNKLDMLVQTLIFVSEGFQQRLRERIEAAPRGPAQMREFIRGNFGPTLEGMEDIEGWKVWIAAWSEATRSAEVRDVIAQRRLLFQKLIGHILVGMDGGLEMNGDEIEELATEIDAYMNGLGLHAVTGETRMDTSSIEKSLMLLVDGRVAAGRQIGLTQTADRSRG